MARVLVGAAATALHEVPRTAGVYDIHVVDTAPRTAGRTMTFPAVDLGNELIAPCRVVAHAWRLGHAQVESIRGVQVLGLEDAVISELLLQDNENGFVAACGGLRRISKFHRGALDESRVREEKYRDQLLERLAGWPPGMRGRKRARWALLNADAACESVAEARLLYILRRAGIAVKSQYHVAYPGGNFYLDFAIPEELLAIEFDGAIKYQGQDRDLVIGDQLYREHLLRECSYRELVLIGDFCEFRSPLLACSSGDELVSSVFDNLTEFFGHRRSRHYVSVFIRGKSTS